MDRPIPVVSPALLLLAVLLVAPPLTAQPCLDFEPDPKPTWVFSGAWKDQSLHLLDVVGRAIIKYSPPSGEGEVMLSYPEPESLEDPIPSLVQSISTGFLVEERDGRFKRFNESFGNYTSVISLIGARSSEGSVLRSIHSWVADAEGVNLLLYGDMQDASGRWYSGFATASLKKPKKFSVVQRIDLNGSARRFYINSQSFMALIDGEGYFLDMSGRPSIKRLSLDGSSPVVRPVGYTQRPVLPDRLTQPLQLGSRGGFDAVKDTFEELQSLQGPIGLMTHKRLLYVLARDSSRWILEVVDPLSGNVRTLYLPSDSPHLMIIPGKEYFALLEKPEVAGLGVQPIDSIRLLPASLFMDQTSPLLDEARSLSVCRGE